MCLPQQDAMFERASQEQDMDAVAVVNADIILYDDFVDALQTSIAYFERFLLIGARYDVEWRGLEPSSIDKAWLWSLRDVASEAGDLHTYGGADYFAWKPRGDPLFAATGSRIPPFTYGRSKADNWVIHTAVQKGLVSVVDGTMAAMALHMTHGYETNEAGNAATKANHSVNDRDYANHWTSTSGDEMINFNKYLAYTFGNFANGNGTPAHAPWEMMECVDPRLNSSKPAGGRQTLCLRHRRRPAACPCTYNPYVRSSRSEVRIEGGKKVCGSTASLAHSENFKVTCSMQQVTLTLL